MNPLLRVNTWLITLRVNIWLTTLKGFHYSFPYSTFDHWESVSLLFLMFNDRRLEYPLWNFMIVEYPLRNSTRDDNCCEIPLEMITARTFHSLTHSLRIDKQTMWMWMDLYCCSDLRVQRDRLLNSFNFRINSVILVCSTGVSSLRLLNLFKIISSSRYSQADVLTGLVSLRVLSRLSRLSRSRLQRELSTRLFMFIVHCSQITDQG